jgi:TonB family protein
MILPIIQSSIILLIALCAAVIERHQSAATRHAILTVGLVCSLAVPFLGGFLPQFETVRRRSPYARAQNPTEIVWNINAESQPASANAFMPVFTPPVPFLWIWIGGTAITGMLLTAGAARIAWLMRKSKPLRCARWIAAAQDISALLRLRRQLRLVQNDTVVLGTWGVLRPKVFLPHDADEWSSERIRAVLIHELAHIKRFDWPAQIFGEAARAVYWFNPLFWIACRWLRSESEQACDDVVLSTGFDAKDYAVHLLDLARALQHANRSWSPVLAMSRPPNLERRFVAMLNPKVNHRSLERATLLLIVALMMAVTVPVAALRAREPLPPALPAPPAAPAGSSSVAISASTKSPKPAPGRPARAQGRADGSLAGTVYDSSGAAVPGVAVTVSTLEITPSGIRESAVATTTSNEAGGFEFAALTPGQYSLKAELRGFANFRKADIQIMRSQTARQNIFMSVGNIAQRVEVTAVGQPRQPVPQVGPRRIRVGGNVVAANLISQVRPVYPQNARDAGIEGTVHLQGIIGPEGNFIALRVVSSNDVDLGNAALEAVRQWRYRPTLLNNQPIEVQTEIDVDFKLAQ